MILLQKRLRKNTRNDTLPLSLQGAKRREPSPLSKEFNIRKHFLVESIEGWERLTK